MNSIEKAWRKFIKECLTKGKWVIKDDGDEILEIIDNHTFIPNIIKSVFGNTMNITLEMFLNLIGEGKFNIKDCPNNAMALLEYVKQLDDPKQIYLEKNTQRFVYTYPERIYHILQSNRKGDTVYENQIETIINRLKEHSGSNRAVANLYMCALDKDEQHIPCLQMIHSIIRNDVLYLCVYFRSNDLYSAFCSNMLFLQYLGLKIVEELKEEYPSLKFGGLYYNSTSLHIYKGDYEQAKKVIDVANTKFDYKIR